MGVEGLPLHLLCAVVFLGGSLCSPCATGSVYGLAGLWQVAGGHLPTPALILFGLVSAAALLANLLLQLADADDNISDSVNDILGVAIGFTGWSRSTPAQAVLQIVSHAVALLASVVLCTAQRSHRNLRHGRRLGLRQAASIGGGTGRFLSLCCVVALLASSLCVRTLLHLPYFTAALVSMLTWTYGGGRWLLRRQTCIALLLYIVVHSLADYIMQIRVVNTGAFAQGTFAAWLGLTPLAPSNPQLWLAAGFRVLLFTVYGSTGWRRDHLDRRDSAAVVRKQASSRARSSLSEGLLAGAAISTSDMEPEPHIDTVSLLGLGARLRGGDSRPKPPPPRQLSSPWQAPPPLGHYTATSPPSTGSSASFSKQVSGEPGQEDIGTSLLLLSSLIQNVCKILITVCTLTWAVAVHSVPSLPILLSAFFMKQLSSGRAFAVSRYVLAYGTVFLVAQYIYDAIHDKSGSGGINDTILLSIGLRPFDRYGGRLALQCSAAVPLAIAGRVGGRDLSNQFLMQVQRKIRACREGWCRVPSASASEGSGAETGVPSTVFSDSALDAESGGTKPRRKPHASVITVLEHVGVMLTSMLKLVCLRLDTFTLLLLFAAGLAKIDLLHAGYVGFCLLFVVFPALSRKAWVILLVYCEVVVLALYMWQFQWIGEEPSGADFAKLLGLQYDVNCTAAVDPENDHVLSEFFLFQCWKTVGLPVFSVILASIQLSIFTGLAAMSNGDQGHSHLNYILSMLEIAVGRAGHYIVVVAIVLVASIGRSNGMHAVLIALACLVLAFAQRGHQRQFSKSIQLLTYVTAFYLALTILAKYIYKFEQIQDYLSATAFLPQLQTLRDIGLTSDIDVYTDLVPDTLLLLLIATVLRLLRGYQTNSDHREQHEFATMVPDRQLSPLTVLWLWAYEQSRLADFISAIAMFGVACSRVSLLNAFYFCMGIIGCCAGRLPLIMRLLTFLVASLHALGIYCLQLDSISESPYTCNIDGQLQEPEPDKNWRCCILWIGVTENGDKNYELFVPFAVLLALDIHRRFHADGLLAAQRWGAVRSLVSGISSPRQSVSLLQQANEPKVSEIAPEPEPELSEDADYAASTQRKKSNYALGAAQWLRSNVSLEKFGLEVLYIVLLYGTIVDANAMSLVYTLVLFLCVISSTPRSARLWMLFSGVSSALLALRYSIYLGMPPCQDFRLPFRRLDSDYRNWLGLGNDCVTSAQELFSFKICSLYDLVVDCLVLFWATAFARTCAHAEALKATPLGRQRQTKPVPEGYGIAWSSHLTMLFWDYGAVTVLCVGLVVASYWHFNVLTLGYLVVGLCLFHRRSKLTDATLETTALMLYAGASLLLQALFQFPYFESGADNNGELDDRSWQVIVGFHKATERTSDLWLASLSFLIAIALRGTVQSDMYRLYVVPLAAREYGVTAYERRQQYLDQQKAEILAQNEKEKQSKIENEGARERLLAAHRAQYRGRKRQNTLVSVAPSAPRNASLSSIIEPDESVDTGKNQDDEHDHEDEVWGDVDEDSAPDQDRAQESIDQVTKLDRIFIQVLCWLYSAADPLLHTMPEVSTGHGSESPTPPAPPAQPIGAQVHQGSGKSVGMLTIAHQHVKQGYSGAKRIASQVSVRSLMLAEATWFAIYGHTLQICVILMCMNFIIHVDLPSCFFPATLFGFCLLIGRNMQAGYWRVSIIMIETRLVLVKLVNAWPRIDFLGLNVQQGFGIWLDLDGWAWDLALFFALLLHRQHLMRRGVWSSKEESLPWLQQLRRIPLLEALPGDRSEGSEPAADARVDRLGTDRYLPMVLAQLLALAMAPLLYAELNSSGGVASLTEQVETNEIASGLVVLMFFQFMMILADYSIYLLHWIRIKQVLQWVALLVYIILYFVWGARTQTSAAPAAGGPSLWLRCFYAANFAYFYFSAVQIGHGYPRVVDIKSKRRLTQSTDSFHSGAVSASRAVPFFTEFVYLVEWLCTSTTLSLYDFVRVEEIYVLLYQGQVFLDKKAAISSEREQGDEQPFWWTKAIYGLGAITLLVAVLWAPLFFFSSAGLSLVATELNNVQQVTTVLSLRVTEAVGTSAVYQLFTAASADIVNQPADELLAAFDPAWQSQLSDFSSPSERDRLQRITVKYDAQVDWALNELARSNLETALALNTTTSHVQLAYTFSREDSTTQPDMSGRSAWVALTSNQTDQLNEMIGYDPVPCNTNADDCQFFEPVTIPSMYPLYLRLAETGAPRQVGNQVLSSPICCRNLRKRLTLCAMAQQVSVELNHNITITARYGALK
eukprot:COSAG01_NODE_419_length_17278_cov_34.763432_3_plen_2268_part_00